ncbi:MAG: Gfo/Idh/MocA family oxidoreductase, partial [Spirochaetaceae bacterium]|nr:Gfo/Idh/MocA family oxidoreductase [Spirochaetaceae bacterium]
MPLRLAVIGAGVMGCSHIERIRTSAECVLAAVCDPDLALATRAAGGCPVHGDLPELLRRERIDGAIIATPNAEHREGGLLCAEAGVPMLVEKPIAASTADGSALVEAAARRGVPLLVGQHRRHSAF